MTIFHLYLNCVSYILFILRGHVRVRPEDLFLWFVFQLRKFVFPILVEITEIAWRRSQVILVSVCQDLMENIAKVVFILKSHTRSFWVSSTCERMKCSVYYFDGHGYFMSLENVCKPSPCYNGGNCSFEKSPSSSTWLPICKCPSVFKGKKCESKFVFIVFVFLRPSVLAKFASLKYDQNLCEQWLIH